MSAGINVQD